LITLDEALYFEFKKAVQEPGVDVEFTGKKFTIFIVINEGNYEHQASQEGSVPE
jgi:hypothetical protein